MKIAREGMRFQLRDLGSSKGLMWSLAVLTAVLGLFTVYRHFVPADEAPPAPREAGLN